MRATAVIGLEGGCTHAGLLSGALGIFPTRTCHPLSWPTIRSMPNTCTWHSVRSLPAGNTKYTYRPPTGELHVTDCTNPFGRFAWSCTHTAFFSRLPGSSFPTKIEYPCVLSSQQSARPAMSSEVTMTSCCMSTRHHGCCPAGTASVCVHEAPSQLLLLLPSTARSATPPCAVLICIAGQAWFLEAPQAWA